MLEIAPHYSHQTYENKFPSEAELFRRDTFRRHIWSEICVPNWYCSTDSERRTLWYRSASIYWSSIFNRHFCAGSIYILGFILDVFHLGQASSLTHWCSISHRWVVWTSFWLACWGHGREPDVGGLASDGCVAAWRLFEFLFEAVGGWKLENQTKLSWVDHSFP